MLNHSATPHVSLGKATADGGTAAPGPAPGPSPFVTAAAFQGARPGCTFGTGPLGLGYYEDGGGQSAAAHAAAEGAARGSQGAGFTLTLARAAVDGEELFSTYDTVCRTRTEARERRRSYRKRPKGNARLLLPAPISSIKKKTQNSCLKSPSVDLSLLRASGGHACGHFLAAELWLCARRLGGCARSCGRRRPHRGPRGGRQFDAAPPCCELLRDGGCFEARGGSGGARSVRAAHPRRGATAAARARWPLGCGRRSALI